MKKKNEVSSTNERILNFLFRPEIIFLVLGTIFGLLFLFLTPPFQVPDEGNHFYRVYQASEGKIFSLKKDNHLGGYVPNSFQETYETFSNLPFHPDTKTTKMEILKARGIKLRVDEKVFVNFDNTALYTPVAYTPQVIGVKLGVLLNLSPLDIMYLGRFLSLIVWLLLTYLSIKIIPTGEWALITISFIPMFIFLVPAINADSLVFGLTALVVAISVRLINSAEKLTKRDLVIISIISIIASLLKMPYSLVFLLFLTIPKSKFGSWKSYVGFWAIILVICLTLIGGWTIAMQNRYVPARYDITPSPTLQLKELSEKPTRMLTAIYQTYIKDVGTSDFNFRQFTGYLGWLDTKLPIWISFLVIANLTVGILSSENIIKKMGNLRKVFSFFFPLGIFMAINFFIYLTWNPVGANYIEGIQGRYFLPLLIVSLIPLSTRKSFFLKIDGKRGAIYFILLQIFILSSTLVYLVWRYY